ncbi:copper chaperone PCu(A)C [Malikia granosa]|nr:copper chaperone PCu(A)C [Malikia granosa]
MKLKPSILAGLLACSACAGPAVAHEYFAPNFILFHPWAVASEEGQADVPVYFTTREVEEGDRLLRAYSPIAESVAFVSADSQALDGLELKSGGGEQFFSSESHLLLKGRKQDLHWGRNYPLVLVFEKAGMMNVSISVGTP